MSELELLYSKACGLPLYVKENKKLEGKISSTKVDVSLQDSLAHYFTLLVLRFIFSLYCLYFETLFSLQNVIFLFTMLWISVDIFFIKRVLLQLKKGSIFPSQNWI